MLDTALGPIVMILFFWVTWRYLSNYHKFHFCLVISTFTPFQKSIIFLSRESCDSENTMWAVPSETWDKNFTACNTPSWWWKMWILWELDHMLHRRLHHRFLSQVVHVRDGNFLFTLTVNQPTTTTTTTITIQIRNYFTKYIYLWRAKYLYKRHSY